MEMDSGSVFREVKSIHKNGKIMTKAPTVRTAILTALPTFCFISDPPLYIVYKPLGDPLLNHRQGQYRKMMAAAEA